MSVTTTVPRIVFAFDRDGTVTTSNGAVELSTIEALRDTPAHEVWAIGNQRLCDEAGIPGIEEARERAADHDDPDLRAGTTHAGRPTRRERIELVGRLFPEHDRYIVVDDVDLSDLATNSRWEYYPPAEFAELDHDRWIDA